MKHTVQVTGFRAHRSGTLFGFATVLIPELHFRIIDCPVHQKGDKHWISMPGKVQLDRDGNVRRDQNGKALYASVLEISDRATRDAFSDRVIAALLERYPLAFDEAAA